MSNESRVRFKDRTLVDSIIENPVDQYQLRSRTRNLVILLIVAAVLAAIAIKVWLT